MARLQSCYRYASSSRCTVIRRVLQGYKIQGIPLLGGKELHGNDSLDTILLISSQVWRIQRLNL